jgi:RHS repeat-associated protein
LLETDLSGSTVARYTWSEGVYGDLVSERVLDAGNWKNRYYHYDGLGSTDRLTGGNQVVQDSYVYRAYGEAVASSGDTPNPFRYVGQVGYYRDGQTSLLYLRARYYDPGVGRFITVDPVKQGRNWYGYVRNNSVNRFDPRGLWIDENGVVRPGPGPIPQEPPNPPPPPKPPFPPIVPGEPPSPSGKPGPLPPIGGFDVQKLIDCIQKTCRGITDAWVAALCIAICYFGEPPEPGLSSVIPPTGPPDFPGPPYYGLEPISIHLGPISVPIPPIPVGSHHGEPITIQFVGPPGGGSGGGLIIQSPIQLPW